MLIRLYQWSHVFTMEAWFPVLAQGEMGVEKATDAIMKHGREFAFARRAREGWDVWGNKAASESEVA